MTTLLASTIGAAALLPLAKAYTFNIDSTPQQCSNLSISIVGNDGTPPYSALILPFGQSPLPNNVEARRIVEHKFDGTSASFQLRYPTNSQFVLVVRPPTVFQFIYWSMLNFFHRLATRERLEVVGQALPRR